MEIEVVSKRILFYCVLISCFLLILKSITQHVYPNYIYICNDNNILDIYKSENNKNTVINPQNLKNLLHCLGKGMQFYERSLYALEGYAPYSIQAELSKRYNIQFMQFYNKKNELYCFKSDTRYLILQKNINIKAFRRALNNCRPTIIIAGDNYRDSKLFKALLSQGYNMIFVKRGEAIKIYL